MMSDRMPSRDGGKTPENRIATDFSKFNVNDSFCNSITDDTPSGGDGGEHRRLSRQRLEEISVQLGERDRKALLSIQRYRYLMSSQIQRLCFTDSATPSAALRAASRCLKRLRELGLVEHLARRIGGVRAGSGSLVWYVTHAGERLLRLHDHTAVPVRRFFEPSPFFLAHTLAVADIAIQMAEICNQHGSKLSVLEAEPDYWRTYSEYGILLSLKPDLYSTTASAQYEDRWFIEVDLSTESPAKIVAKCERYHQYYRSGLEQQESGVFPLTVWIVPTAERKERLISCIREAFENQPRLFAVITRGELEHLILHGGDEGTLC